MDTPKDSPKDTPPDEPVPLELLDVSVSIAGFVIDQQTQQRIPRVRVEIIAGPSLFEVKRGVKKQLAGLWEWERLPERIDRKVTRPDGSFFFERLPPGAYRLRCSMPDVGGGYQVAETDTLEVPADAVAPLWVTIALTPNT